MEILAEEIDLKKSELVPSSDFVELGVDSLLSLNIAGRLREELGLDADGSLFADCFVVADLLQALQITKTTPSTHESTSRSPLELDSASAASGDDDTDKSSLDDEETNERARAPSNIFSDGIPLASSVLMQGSPKTATKTLFLFPEGSGSATAYSSLPRISFDIAIYGLNCPCVNAPQNMYCGIEALTPRYLQEIRRRQPHGPYYFAGWSAGGI